MRGDVVFFLALGAIGLYAAGRALWWFISDVTDLADDVREGRAERRRARIEEDERIRHEACNSAPGPPTPASELVPDATGRSSEESIAEALCQVGDRHYQGGRLEEAELAWRDAATARSTRATINLACIAYETGDSTRALSWFITATGDSRPGGALNTVYLRLHAATRTGDTGAMVLLGLMGLVEDRDPNAGLYWFERAAQRGHVHAYWLLSGQLAVMEEDAERSNLYFLKALEAHHPHAVAAWKARTGEATD